MYRLISIALYLHFIKKATDRDKDMNFVFFTKFEEISFVTTVRGETR